MLVITVNLLKFIVGVNGGHGEVITVTLLKDKQIKLKKYKNIIEGTFCLDFSCKLFFRLISLRFNAMSITDDRKNAIVIISFRFE